MSYNRVAWDHQIYLVGMAFGKMPSGKESSGVKSPAPASREIRNKTASDFFSESGNVENSFILFFYFIFRHLQTLAIEKNATQLKKKKSRFEKKLLP